MAKGRFIALGIALGAVLGAAFHNVAMGVAFGVVAGAVLSAAAYRKATRAKGPQGQKRLGSAVRVSRPWPRNSRADIADIVKPVAESDD